MQTSGRYRRIVRRHGRRFIICGLQRPMLLAPELAPLRLAWTLRATLLVAAVLLAYISVRPPAVPTSAQPPPLSFARYSIDDFANASR